MKNHYIELDRLLRHWDAQQKVPLTAGQRAVLVELGRREDEGLRTIVTDLVQMIRLGTGPTVHGHLLRLESDGLIQKVVSDQDARAVNLVVTAPGNDYLRALSNLVKAANR